MQCVVLAGGRGTRMRPFTDTRPKCLVPVAGRPFIDWQLAWLASEEVRRVLLSVGYRAELVRQHVGDGSRFGLEVDYVEDGEPLLGTAGALRRSFDEEKLGPTFFLLYGDSYLPVRLREVSAAYHQRRAPVLMTLYEDPGRLERPNAVYQEGMVTRYEKGLPAAPPDMRHVDFGLSVWDRRVIPEWIPSGATKDLAVVFDGLSREGRLAGLEVRQRFYEVGSIDGLRDLEALIERGGAIAPPPAGAPAGGDG